MLSKEEAQKLIEQFAKLGVKVSLHYASKGKVMLKIDGPNAQKVLEWTV